MPVSHNNDITATPEFAELRRFVEARGCESPEKSASSFGAFEQELVSHVLKFASAVIGAEMERFDIDAEGVIYEGVRFRAKRSSSQTYITLAGPATVERTVYVERGGNGGKQLVPLEKRLGIVNSEWSLKAAEVGCRFMEESTSKKSAELLALATGIKQSASHLDRLPKIIGKKWEGDRVAIEVEVAGNDIFPDSQDVAAIMVSLDGVMLPMKDAPRSSSASGPKGYQEAACGVICLIGNEGERLKTLRFARMPESKKVTLRAQLTQEMKHLKTIYPGVRWQAVADGARSNWTLFSQLASDVGVELEHLLDFWHGMEHLGEAISLAFGKGSQKATEELSTWRETLKTNKHGPGKLLRRLTELETLVKGKTNKEAFRKEIRYFQTNKEAGRMRWAAANNNNLPIGSGVIEASCKTLVTQRMKRSGMSWRHQGGQAILTLRSLHQSERMEAAWLVLGNRFREKVVIDPDTTRKRPTLRLAA